ncbi:hypothetical protein OAP08_05435 [Akkermansiaceae bacterium]|nr:hypothetical protein [Akkermansiaceae bacterium]MDB4760175.1 hypothetical protein [bacterium]MDA7789898.1 hypothetical protein [Akkermansiaceae bacterium]MDB4440754.1 hypothetical protein [Akkermansiaceae bacterium]MDB4510987.1 hypothetical protein [Akkermansiaceae bacterium]
MKLIPKHFLTLTSLLIQFTQAELILLEHFDYEGTDAPLNELDGGEGFDGPWAVTGWSRNFDIGRTAFAQGSPGTTINLRGGLEFPDHPSSGTAVSRFGTAGQREGSRTLSAESQAVLTADNTTIWFSMLTSAPDNNRYGTMVFGTDILKAAQGESGNGNLTSDTGQAFGFGYRSAGGVNGNLNAVAFVDSATATVEDSLFLPPLDPEGTHHDTALTVGKINWKPDGTPDQFFLFNITADSMGEPLEADAIASIEADFKQSDFSLISMQDTGATIFDEIRFGTAFVDVVPGGNPNTPLSITEIAYSKDTKNVILGWNSTPGAAYIIKYSNDLVNWDNDLDDGITSDGDTTSRTFTLSDFGLDSLPMVFFRVERDDTN